MNIYDVRTRKEMDRLGAEALISTIRAKPDCHLVLATGGSPAGAYALVAQAVAAGSLDCSRVKVTMLDEWYGIPQSFAGSSYSYLMKFVIGAWGCPMSEFLIFDSEKTHPRTESKAISLQFLARPQPDLCVLGVGTNGHIGLNEPDAMQLPTVHVSELAEETMGHAMLEGLERPPIRGLTLGVGDILSAKSILLLACGFDKQEAIGSLRQGRISTYAPVSFLWLHPDATALVAEMGTPVPG